MLSQLNGEVVEGEDGGRLTEANLRKRLEECGSEESLTEEEKTAVICVFACLCVVFAMSHNKNNISYQPIAIPQLTIPQLTYYRHNYIQLSLSLMQKVMLLLFDAFAPELNLDDSLALILTITKKILNVEQVRLYWPVDVSAKRMWVRAVDGAIKNTPVKWGSSAALLASYATNEERQLHWDARDPDQAAV